VKRIRDVDMPMEL